MTAAATKRSAPRNIGLGLKQLYLYIALALTALPPLLSPIAMPDFWWHLAEGRLIVQSHHIPLVDTFSFTQAGRPFYDQGWLAQILMYSLHQAGGAPLLLITQALVMVLAYGLLLYLTIRECGRIRLAVVLLLLVIQPTSYSNWHIRPQSYALPLFAAYLLILTSYRLRWENHLWLLPPIMMIWVNLHGSFPLGLALIALVLLGEGIRRWRGSSMALTGKEWQVLASWGVATAIATLANPRGAAIFSYVRHLIGSRAVTELITEWASPTPHDWVGKPFYLLMIAMFLAYIYARKRTDTTDMLLSLAFLWLALSALRNIIWFAMVVTPPMASALASRLHKPEEIGHGNSIANAALAEVVSGVIILASPWIKPALGLPAELGSLYSANTPTATVRYLRALPAAKRPKRLFHTEAFGSYLMWAAPEQRVFIDPRIELYPYALIKDSQSLNGDYNTAELLNKYAFDGLLLDPARHKQLKRRVMRSGRWRIAYQDRASMLFLPAR